MENKRKTSAKTEPREPSLYNCIFEAIATGSSRLNAIAQKIPPRRLSTRSIEVLRLPFELALYLQVLLVFYQLTIKEDFFTQNEKIQIITEIATLMLQSP